MTPDERAAELMRGKGHAERWQVAFDELLVAVTAFQNDVGNQDDLKYRAKVAEAIANAPVPAGARADVVDQVRFIRDWYGEINAREDDPKVGEILDQIGGALAGQDVRQATLDLNRRLLGE